MLHSLAVLMLVATSLAQDPPATRVELLSCKAQEGTLRCAADIHVDPKESLVQDDMALFTIGYLARRKNGVSKVIREHIYPVPGHALRRSIPIPLAALEDEELVQPAQVKLALFRVSEGSLVPRGTNVMVALSAEVSLDDLPDTFDWTPNPELYAGGDGSDCGDEAIVILAKTTRPGQRAEHDYIRQMYPGASVTSQGVNPGGERSFDTFELLLPGGRALTLCFDVTAFYGKF